MSRNEMMVQVNVKRIELVDLMSAVSSVEFGFQSIIQDCTKDEVEIAHAKRSLEKWEKLYCSLYDQLKHFDAEN